MTTGADQETTDRESAFDVAETAVGARGAPTVTGPVGTDAGLGPAEFMAVTANVSSAPGVSPVKVQVVVLEMQVAPPGVDVTV